MESQMVELLIWLFMTLQSRLLDLYFRILMPRDRRIVR